MGFHFPLWAGTLAKGKIANIYSSSKYAFRVAHNFGMLWKQGVSVAEKKPILTPCLIFLLTYFTSYYFMYPLTNYWASLVAQMVKCLPAMWETWVRFLAREDPLEKEMAIHSSTLAWKIPWMEEPDRLQSMGSQRVGYD